ncbi:putative translation initiation factor eIF epsilon subunit [Babesia bovis T2Bo]|uniref:Translation initiation factor eIF2B subunit epsilon n=1 Tax=Babesia bovis TaxID=5865 RepID=A7AVB1_BABBO|nr:putative translation initiation factor eIF epsilon subunit [Babesia bovis T2Bo]EDO05737.1 putative translation initiation factor eIF epsilon subunit [Babesia bovis T2Bo]|eukprot:XP_001609305.1 translation initiation factor eIF epsilon subunit [Babesia bovis T2Bo]
MEVFMLVTEDVLAFEPLSSAVNVCDLYIGEKAIFQETLENLYESGINHVTLVTTKHKVATLDQYKKRYTFGKRQGHIDINVLGINVDKILPGNVLRELIVVRDGLEEFILMYWVCLLTIPLSEAIELHHTRKAERLNYSMSVLYFEDGKNRLFSKATDDCIVLVDRKSEIVAYRPRANSLRLDINLIQKLKGDSTMFSRYDLCETGIYICRKQVAEHFTNWYEHVHMEDYIKDCLTREFKSDEVYITVMQSDLMFPSYPPALRIQTPKDYYTLYMEYIRRFNTDAKPSVKVYNTHESHCGPIVHDKSLFCNGSGIVPPLAADQAMLSSVHNSIVGKGFKIGHNSTVDRCIIFDEVTIGSNCAVRDSIIMNNVTIDDSVVIPPGSIVCSGVNITNKSLSGLDGTLRISRMQSRYIDLTNDNAVECTDPGNYIWPISAFGNVEDTIIGKSFYDIVKFGIPSGPTDSGSDDEDSDFDQADDDESYASSESDDVSEISEPSGDLSDHDMDPDIATELQSLVLDCLKAPTQLSNKVLEIKSLKISHNLQKDQMVKVAFRDALEWIVDQSNEADLRELMETSRLKELLDSFEHQIAEEEYYKGILEVCEQKNKDLDFFSHLCEALYHSDTMEFEMLRDWLTRNNISGERINSFADWLAED